MKHHEQVLNLLNTQIGNPAEVKDISDTAKKVAREWVDPVSGGKESINGLVYGLVQSGKTGVLSVSGAIGADEGYRTIIILTSDNDALYAQTLTRVRQAFPGMDILAKSDFRDTVSFVQRIKSGTCCMVTTKNGSLLESLIENFQSGNVKGLSALIIDDEADQASLNTKAGSRSGGVSKINEKISKLRRFFDKNTYLQVTATPQALFLQESGHSFRPKFTILSHPGADYVGGNDFFGNKSNLVREFDIGEITALSPGAQPTPSMNIPTSLLRALDTFMIGATYKRIKEADQNCAFLCHVSTLKADHSHIVDLLREYKTKLATGLKKKQPAVLARLKKAYDDLAATHSGVKGTSFGKLIADIEFFSPGITVKLVNGETDEDVAVDSPYNLFVGGNKLGRGVTIKNLLVSYYGRNPKKPQADTVLQHARMYGYRRKDIGLLRLFLPQQLHNVFKAINNMEQSLRELIQTKPSEEFRGIYISNGLKATRRNVLAPGSIGIYSAGSNYNPAQILRDTSVKSKTDKIDAKLRAIKDKGYREVPISEIKQLIGFTAADENHSEYVWNPTAISESVEQLAKLLRQNSGYVYVDRDRDWMPPGVKQPVS
jgi:Z1 domain